MTKQKLLLVIFLFVIPLFFLLGYLKNSKSFVFKSKASNETVSVRFEPNSGSFDTGEEQNINLIFSTDNQNFKISALGFSLKINSGAIFIKSGTPSDLTSGKTGIFQTVKKQISKNNSQIELAYTSLLPSESLPANVKIPLVIKGLTPGTSVIQFVEQSVEITGTSNTSLFDLKDPAVKVEYVFTGDSVPTPTMSVPTITPTTTPNNSEAMNVYFLPELLNNKPNVELALRLLIDNLPTTKTGISAFELNLTFDSELIEILSVTPTNTIFQEIAKQIDNTNGAINLTYNAGADTENFPKDASIEITLKGKKEGTGQIVINKAEVFPDLDSDPIAINSKNGALAFSNDYIEPTPTNALFDPKKTKIRVKFQGIGLEEGQNNSPSVSTIKAKLTVLKTNGEFVNGQNGTDIDFTYLLETGFWESEITNIPPGNNYLFIIKGPKHLARKYCETRPATNGEINSYSCGGKSITLTDSENLLNFTALPLLAGDLPQQDKVLNAADFNSLMGCIGKIEDSCANADLNYDGVINATDTSILYASMKLKYDDEQ